MAVTYLSRQQQTASFIADLSQLPGFADLPSLQARDDAPLG
jgi:hypothetical protein